MRFMIRLALFSASLWTVDAFTGHSRPSRVSLKHTGTTSTTLQARGLFVPNLPNPFADLQQGDVNPFGKGFEDDKPFDPSPEGLIRQAKKVLSAELGLLDPTLLDDNEFEWIGPYVDRPLDKTDYLAAGRFFAITTAFPDLNFRAHDFRVDDDDDDDDAATVRMTCRTTGTMRGELRLRDEILPPTGNVMSCPPEAVSLTFDLETGKVVKICSGFCMDRVVGNTDGTTGVMAAAITGGKPISNWEVYPPLTVLQRIFGRPEAPIEEVKNFLAPFPETVMIQLAKGILTSNMAVEDPSLLSEDFVFSTPSAGPIGKKEFLAKYAPEEFNGVQPKFRNYRVDPYDPNRVWVDVTPTGPGYVGSPQAMSFAFDADGFCTRITSWYVMDPTVGNGGGLGGPEGFKFAQGSANEFAARPLPRILGRVKNSFLDLFRPKGKKKMPVPVSIPPPPPKKPVAAAVPKPSTPVQRLATSTTPSSAPVSSERERLPIPLQKLAKSFGTINLLEMQRESAAQRKQREPPKTKTATKTTGVAQSFKDQFAKQKEALTAQAKALQVKQKETNAALKKQEEEAARKKQAVELAQKRKQEQAAAAAEQKRKQQQEAAAAAAQKRKQQQQAAEKKQAAAAAQKRQQQEVAEQQRRQQLEQQKGLAAQKAAEQKARREAQAKAQADKRAVEQKRREDAARKAANAEAKRIAQEKARQEQELAKKVASEKKKRELEERKQADLEKKQKLAQERALKEQRLAQQREMERKKNERIESEKRKQEERVRLAKQAKKEETVLKALSKSPVVSTFRLFGLGGSDDDADDSDIKAAPVRMQSGVKKAPRGVPMLSRWRRNLDGSVSGFVSGSRSFANGERITTSPIKSGNLSSGEVVVTGSGSKYFLE